jgi:hypothetical protein
LEIRTSIYEVVRRGGYSSVQNRTKKARILDPIFQLERLEMPMTVCFLGWLKHGPKR